MPRILIIDDEPSVRELLYAMLIEEGCEVAGASLSGLFECP